MSIYVRIVALALCFSLPKVAFSWATGDSLRYLTAKDTIFLSLDELQEKIFEHRIARKQTIFSLTRFYGLTLDEIYYYNPELKDNVISEGQAIKIPIPNRAIMRYKGTNFDINKYVPIYYVVKNGDNLFRISKKYFGMPVDTVMKRNNLADHNIKVGQALHVGWMSQKGIPASYRKYRGRPEWKKNSLMARKYHQDSQVKKEKTEQGVAFWQQDGKQKADLYALHRTAPINSIIAVSNPMKRRTIYAKVIGRIPENIHRDDVIVVLSSKAAEQLGAKDPRFFVKLKFLKK